MSYGPTTLFTILEPQDQVIGEFCVAQERRATDFEDLKLWIGSPGEALIGGFWDPKTVNGSVGRYRIFPVIFF